ncbi:class I SAM-dependent methyltransferase [Phycicoccus sp. CSK15P-2]|uniref:class I SAM-dependent methyltransferase n=1 Tax=Phycicoccus sp. CSK15P-2 TaxID=2807627 RepID=UPI001952867A|nr:class I SAM-dependent methyltransferase [Phycicoccus sp. CSK15P-2]MBM6405637.1 class I SAM-dependent methyltransferase [Phycicoccus sp. CSK15P-2]
MATTSDGFAQWYADMGATADKDQLWSRLLGLPPHLVSSSLVTGTLLDEIEASLALGPDDVLVELACGRAGYGLELAARSGCRLVAVDFAAPAIEQARGNAAALGLDGVAELHVADMTETGLPAAVGTALICLDAVQFPDDFMATFGEARRLLRAGSTAIFTCWEAPGRNVGAFPERLRRVDVGAGMSNAGFTDVDVAFRPDLRELELAAWRTVAQLPPSDDPAMAALQEEAADVLARPVAERVIGVGHA